MADQEPRKEVIVERERSSHTGLIVGVVVVVVLIVIAIYGLPMLTGGGSTPNVEVTPTTGQ